VNEADLVDAIRAYWRERGQPVNAAVREVVEPLRGGGGTARYHAVRSGMINGVPPAYAGELAMPAP